MFAGIVILCAFVIMVTMFMLSLLSLKLRCDKAANTFDWIGLLASGYCIAAGVALLSEWTTPTIAPEHYSAIGRTVIRARGKGGLIVLAIFFWPYMLIGLGIFFAYSYASVLDLIPRFPRRSSAGKESGGVRRLRTIAVALGVAALIGASAMYLYNRVGEGPGPKLQRECASVVETVLKQEPTVRRADLESELQARGVSTPTLPRSPSLTSDVEKWKEQEKRYEAAMNTYRAKWNELEKTSVYRVAWESAFAKKRDDAIRQCVYERAQREGVRAR